MPKSRAWRLPFPNGVAIEIWHDVEPPGGESDIASSAAPGVKFPSFVLGGLFAAMINGVDDEHSNKLKQFVRQTVPSIAGRPAVDMAGRA
jgi:hypothetical protein